MSNEVLKTVTMSLLNKPWHFTLRDLDGRDIPSSHLKIYLDEILPNTTSQKTEVNVMLIMLSQCAIRLRRLGSACANESIDFYFEVKETEDNQLDIIRCQSVIDANIRIRISWVGTNQFMIDYYFPHSQTITPIGHMADLGCILTYENFKEE